MGIPNFKKVRKSNEVLGKGRLKIFFWVMGEKPLGGAWNVDAKPPVVEGKIKKKQWL